MIATTLDPSHSSGVIDAPRRRLEPFLAMSGSLARSQR
jgi:hypothetical protein